MRTSNKDLRAPSSRMNGVCEASKRFKVLPHGRVLSSRIKRENKEICERPPVLSSIEAGNALYSLKQERKVILRRRYTKRGPGIASYK